MARGSTITLGILTLFGVGCCSSAIAQTETGKLSRTQDTGVCAGVETLLRGDLVWCSQTEDAYYVLTAQINRNGKSIPANLKPYIINWAFYFRAQNMKRLNFITKMLKHGDNAAGFIVFDEYMETSNGKKFQIESRYNMRGQLVMAKVLQ